MDVYFLVWVYVFLTIFSHAWFVVTHFDKIVEMARERNPLVLVFPWILVGGTLIFVVIGPFVFPFTVVYRIRGFFERVSTKYHEMSDKHDP